MNSKCCAKCRWFVRLFFNDDCIGECIEEAHINPNPKSQYGGYPISGKAGCEKFESKIIEEDR